jgi:DNA-binding NarL/FixJ family response regulator
MATEQVNMKRIKIFLSDPQILFREGMHFILSGEDDFEVTGETTNNEDALTYIETNPPQIAVLNIEDKKYRGPEITRLVKRRFPDIATILTIEKSDGEQLLEVMRSGASACLTKNIDPEHLLNTIRDVSQGDLPIIQELLTPEIAAKVLAEFEDIKYLNESMGNLLAGLSTKESQILSRIAAGENIEEAATKLNTDEDSIRDNLKTILNKLVANDQTQAVIMTVQRGLPVMISDSGRSKKNTEQYLTQEETHEEHRRRSCLIIDSRIAGQRHIPSRPLIPSFSSRCLLSTSFETNKRAHI